jgi:hypothetical protein
MALLHSILRLPFWMLRFGIRACDLWLISMHTMILQEDGILFPDGIPSVGAFARLFPSFKNIIVLSGAGLSTAAGIPVLSHSLLGLCFQNVCPQDYRTSGTGLFSLLTKHNLPQPECLFDIECEPVTFSACCEMLNFVQVFQGRSRATLRLPPHARCRYAAGIVNHSSSALGHCS